MCPPGPRLQALSALSPLWLPLQTSAAMCRSGLVSALPCIRLVSALAVLPSVESLMLPFVSAIYPLLVFSLSSRCSLFIRSLSGFGRVYGLALAGPLSALCPLFGFCAFVCSVSVVVHLSRCLCGCAFARRSFFSRQCSHVCLKASPRIFSPCLSFSPFVLFSVFV